MARALKFAWGCGRPWLLLLPDFVSRKSYFKQLSQSASVDCPHLPWFLGPRHSMCHALSFVLFLHLHLMRIRYTFAAPRTAHTGSHLVDANVRHVSSQGASVFAAPFQCVWFMQLGTAGRAPLFHVAASTHVTLVLGKAIRARMDQHLLQPRSYAVADCIEQVVNLLLTSKALCLRCTFAHVCFCSCHSLSSPQRNLIVHGAKRLSGNASACAMINNP